MSIIHSFLSRVFIYSFWNLLLNFRLFSIMKKYFSLSYNQWNSYWNKPIMLQMIWIMKYFQIIMIFLMNKIEIDIIVDHRTKFKILSLKSFEYYWNSDEMFIKIYFKKKTFKENYYSRQASNEVYLMNWY
jgi:hypothetical protein